GAPVPVTRQHGARQTVPCNKFLRLAAGASAYHLPRLDLLGAQHVGDAVAKCFQFGLMADVADAPFHPAPLADEDRPVDGGPRIAGAGPALAGAADHEAAIVGEVVFEAPAPFFAVGVTGDDALAA